MSHQISAVLFTPKDRRNQGPAEETFETEKGQQVARLHVSYKMVVVVVIMNVISWNEVSYLPTSDKVVTVAKIHKEHTAQSSSVRISIYI
jgi:hypothetical protein